MTNQRIRFEPELLMRSLDNDEELLEELLGAYVEDAPVRLAELARAVDAADMSAVVKAAHSLKGMSGVIRVPGLEKSALELEVAGREERVEDVRDMFLEFRANIEGVLEQARDYLS